MSARADLPPDVDALVEAVVAGARLRPRERALVRAELEDHFLEALASRRGADAAVREFGDPSLAAMLIGRARRRNRNGAERLLRSASIAAACLASAIALPYGYSAWRLGAAPAASEAPAVDALVDGRPIAPERDVVAAALEQALDRVYPPEAGDPRRAAHDPPHQGRHADVAGGSFRTCLLPLHCRPRRGRGRRERRPGRGLG